MTDKNEQEVVIVYDEKELTSEQVSEYYSINIKCWNKLHDEIREKLEQLNDKRRM